MTNVTTAQSFETTFGIAEEVVIVRGEMSIDPNFQMRESMDHSVIDDYVEVLDQLPPVHVFEVEHACGTSLILVDGFHRYFAYEKAEVSDIRAKVIKGTYEEAMTYAMTANFAHLKNGSKPSKDDQKKAIRQLCEVMMTNFGYDSKRVVPALKKAGVASSDRWLRKCTETIRENIDIKRNEKIIESASIGLSNSEIAKELECSRDTVRRVLDTCRNRNDSAIVTMEDIELHFADKAHHEEPVFEFDMLDLDIEDEAPAINPAEAQSKTLQKFDEDLKASQEIPKDITSSSSSYVTFNTETIGNAKSKVLQIEDTFQYLIEAWETHGKEGFDTFLKTERETFLNLVDSVGVTLK